MTLVRALTSWLLLPVLLPELFGHPTIEGLAAFLDQRQFLTRRGAQDFRIVPGSGRHLEMLDEPHVAKNATLVQAMLEEIARRYTSRWPQVFVTSAGT